MKHCPKCYLVGDDLDGCINKASGFPCPEPQEIDPTKTAVLSYRGEVRAVAVSRIAAGKVDRMFTQDADVMDAALVLPTPPEAIGADAVMPELVGEQMLEALGTQDLMPAAPVPEPQVETASASDAPSEDAPTDKPKRGRK